MFFLFVFFHQEPAVEDIGPEAEVNDGLTDTPVSAQEVTGRAPLCLLHQFHCFDVPSAFISIC